MTPSSLQISAEQFERESSLIYVTQADKPNSRLGDCSLVYLIMESRYKLSAKVTSISDKSLSHQTTSNNGGTFPCRSSYLKWQALAALSQRSMRE